MSKLNLSMEGAPVGAFRAQAALAAVAVASVLLLGNGCDRDQVSRSSTAKEAPAGAMPAMPGGELPPPPKPSGKSVLQWTLPKGWSEVPGPPMRFATFNVPGAGKVELAVTVLPGPAGGELANVNRWRGQIGLAPWDDKALEGARKTIKAKAGGVSVFDFSSEGQVQSRMVVGLLATADGNTWFLKLTGEAGATGKAKPDFLKMLESLHLD